MGRAKPVELDHLHFEKQGDAKEYFRKILKKYSPPADLDEYDHIDVLALLNGHPDAQRKIAVGVKKIIVDFDAKGGQCFHVIRNDGSKDNFSITKCISGDHSDFTKFSIASRRAVEKELYDFKENEFSKGKGIVECPVTKEMIEWDDAHVDHKVPMTFSVIVLTFINMNEIDTSGVSYNNTNTYGNEFNDPSLAEQFADWHRKNAVLRLIKAKANYERAYQGRVKPTKSDKTLD